jgi:hypothetical protein
MSASVKKTRGEELTYQKVLDLRQTETTPDFLKLKLINHHFVMVFGKDQENFCEAVGDYLGKGATCEKNMALAYLQTKRGTEPLVIEKPVWNMGGVIEGDIFHLDTLSLAKFDEKMKNNNLTRRRIRYMKLLDHNVDVMKHKVHPMVAGWVYFADDDYYVGLGAAMCTPYLTQKNNKVYRW